MKGLAEPEVEYTGEPGAGVNPVEVEVCNDLPIAGEISSPGLGWTDASVCNASGGLPYGALGVRTLNSFEIKGTSSSPTPPAYVRIVAQTDDGSTAYPDAANLRSDNSVVASESGGDWGVVSNLLDNLNMCSYNCVWAEVVVEMQDPTRTSSNDCQDYTPSVELCLNFTEVQAARSAPIYSTCAAGSGRFRLLPRRLINKDGDASYSMILSPVQVSGTGAMTGEAWITSLDLVEDQGKTLRIIKPNQQFRFDNTDQLVDKHIVSIVLLEENDPTEGAFSGGAPIVIEEVPETTTAHFEADIAWTCGTVPESGERNPPQGYVVTPTGLDCLGSWKQKFTVRPVPYLSPKHLWIERYGHVEDREAVKLTAGQNGYSFDHRRGDFRLRGRLSSYDGQGATLVLEEASIKGVDVCDAGTYTLPPEE